MHRSAQQNAVVAIGMPVFNNEHTIALAISSILHQTFEDWRLLILDDGSTDNTFEVANSFCDPRIIVMRGDENRRLPARLNECVRMAETPYFARMDGDDVAYPDRLELQVTFLDSHPDVDLAAGWALVFGDDGGCMYTLRGHLAHEQIWTRPWMGMLMPHSTWVGKTNWFQRNPYRDVYLAEDQDLLFRTYHKSRFATVPEIVLGYRDHERSTRARLLQRWRVCKAAMRILSERRELGDETVCFASHAAKALAETGAMSVGLGKHLFQRGAGAVSAVEAKRWRSILEDLESALEMHCGGFETDPLAAEGQAH